MQQAIAILDSGVGGLTVVREVMRQLPQEKVIYFGDTARTPYGPRQAEEVVEFTLQIVQYLTQFNPKMVVIACNTATALAVRAIRASVTIPVLGVIHPGARAAIKSTRNGRVGVIGTENTIKSGAYQHALQMISPNLKVESLACPHLVPIVEQGLFRSAEAWETVRTSLAPLRTSSIDCLILGCTHYPFLSEAISEVMGTGVKLINSAEETAREISAILYHRGQLAASGDVPVHQFFCSGDPAKFQHIAQEWLGDQIAHTPVVWQMARL
ncbi:glutamate racemase [Paenibacillus sp. HJGM_3]|uniref:glutamate racemase n=1 Tax=Paenibacillus sp. HJGM_3 TaxID=3379816 RepID=UPI00385FBDA6